MTSAPIKVLVRSRPTANFAQSNVQIDENTGHVTVKIPKASDQGMVNHQQETWGFQFDKVLTNASQEVVFNLVAKQIMLSSLQGYSGSILCYGQTGAGKTFTMTGARNDYKYRGIIPRLISSLFQQINSRYEHHIEVSVTYLQLYNQSLYDLLDPMFQREKNLTIQEDNKGYVAVKGLSQFTCANESQALELLFAGQTNRTIAEHKLNKNSSRSHCIFTIHLKIRSKVESSQKVIISKINLVDLAGSERTKKTGSEGKTLVQAQFINKSLSFLEQLVIALSQKKRDHIPYRQNKLTYLLKDSIGGNSKTYMVANIWPEFNHLQQTISTLKFASRMMKLTNEISIQMNLDPQILIKRYQKEVKQLKQELAMHDTLTNRGRITYQPYTAQQQYQQQKLAKDYLEGKIQDIQIESLRQVRELFTQFKNIYKNVTKDISNNSFIPQKQENQQNKKLKETTKYNGVGIEENSYGFGVGKSSKDSKPSQNISNLVNVPKDEFKEVEQLKPEKNQKKTQKLDKKIVDVNRNEAYLEFKSTVGLEINNTIIKNNEQLKMRKEQIKQKTEEVQYTKTKLEDVTERLRQKEANKTQQEISQGIIDEEEFELLKQKKQYKKTYKLQVQKVKAMRNHLVEIDQNLTTLKTTLLQKFQQWFLKKYGINLHDIQNPLINKKNEDEEQQLQNISDDDVDEDALAYIKAKKKITEIQKARKQKY